jgi:hypothetical protein
MNDIDTPTQFAKRLTKLFPSFGIELEGEELRSYHHVVFLLSPVVTEYLRSASVKTVEEFCRLINAMVACGGEKENAISTCLLEHACQLEINRIIRPHLSSAAKRELR